ncbi:MAG: peptidylprolyl isomerase [Burkholderiales bacterium]|nr:peptidylprolyl isomerase [Burkholderiales bacterium]
MNIRSFLRPRLAWLAFTACMASAGAVCAPTAAGDTVLISNSAASVTRAEFDAELLRIPADARAGVTANPRRVNDLLVRMLVQKTLAARARAAKLDESPEARLRAQAEIDRLLAQLMMERVEADAAADFEANRARFELRARELYALDRARFSSPELVSATHILFDPKKRGADEAKRLAQETRAKVVAGADMAKLAADLSDDPTARRNLGSVGYFAKKDMAPEFAEAAFALKSPGDVAEPVLSEFGWHVIRLDGRQAPAVKSFDEARETLMADLKKRHVADKRDEAISAINRDPATQVNREAVGAVVQRVDGDAAVRALEARPSGAPPAAPR